MMGSIVRIIVVGIIYIVGNFLAKYFENVPFLSDNMFLFAFILGAFAGVFMTCFDDKNHEDD